MDVSVLGFVPQQRLADRAEHSTSADIGNDDRGDDADGGEGDSHDGNDENDGGQGGSKQAHESQSERAHGARRYLDFKRLHLRREQSPEYNTEQEQ